MSDTNTRIKYPTRKLLWFLTTMGVCLFVLSLFAWHLRAKSFKRWLQAENNQLTPYSTVLIEIDSDSSPISVPDPIDQVLIESIHENRQVRHMSRSPYWYSLSKHQAWGKIHLETDTSTTAGISLKINLLVELKRNSGKWKVNNLETLMIP